METKHAIACLVCAVCGGAIGSALSGAAAIRADAQTALNDSQDPQIRMNNVVLVPEDGLRFIRPDGSTIAFMGITNGSGTFYLLDATGEPAISMSAGTSGRIEINAGNPDSTIRLSSIDGKSVTGLGASSSRTGFFTSYNGASTELTVGPSATMLSIFGPSGAQGFELTAAAAGGTFTLFGNSKKPAVTIEGDGPGGLFNVRDEKGLTTASISGSGKFASVENGKVLWQAPPTSKGG